MGSDGFEAASTRLLNALTGACVRALRRQDAICVATSGGLDSSVLAALLSKHGDIPVQLITVGVGGAVDPQRARILAHHLGQPLLEVVLTPRRVEALLPRLVPLIGASPVEAALAAEWNLDPSTRFVSPLRTSWELPIFAAAMEAHRYARRMVVGQGADEWLLGYGKYVDLSPQRLRDQSAADRAVLSDEIVPLEARIARACGVALVYPYLDPVVRSVCERLPLEFLLHQGERKRVLREVARRLDLPLAVVEVPKTAAQYGSGVSVVLKELADRAGQHQNEFLTSFLDQRRTGELHSLRT